MVNLILTERIPTTKGKDFYRHYKPFLFQTKKKNIALVEVEKPLFAKFGNWNQFLNSGNIQC